MSRAPLDLAQVVAQVRQSKRYRGVAPEVVQRIAAQEARHHKGKALVKAIKKHLHRVYGAYLPSPPRYARLLERLEQAQGEGGEAVRTVILEAMSAHASTRERVPVMDAFLRELEDRVGRPERVLDLACGMQPLAWAWWRPQRLGMARDIDGELMGFLAQALALLGVPAQTDTVDLHGELELPEADMVFLLKTLPCLRLELQRPAMELLDALPAPIVVVSFPTRSLGRRNKGMRANYGQRFESELQQSSFDWDHFEVPGELVYVLRR